SPPNKTAHHTRKLNKDGAYNEQKPSYRSFQPVFKHKTVYPRHDARDYDITSYDTEYGGVVSNFTSSIYDDNPQLFPANQCSPQVLASPPNKTAHHTRKLNKDGAYNEQKPSYRSFQPVFKHKTVYPRHDARDYDITSYDTEYGGVVSNFTSSIYDDNPQLYPNPEFLPDDSLADADLKEHNIIDSVTNYAAEFRRSSKLYPIDINLCCCLAAATQIYIQAVMGVSSPSQCERIALVLHYTHICCAMWIVALAAAVAEYCACDTFLPLKYNYLLAYGVPAVIVMFNYALSMEHYETKHYCWMSIEKGMVMGFMIPAMILILINTAIVILGLQSVNKKQAEVLATKIQELVDHHIANWPTNEIENMGDKNASLETLDNIYTPGSSRKNTDSSETLDKDNYLSEDECSHYPNNLVQVENGTEGVSSPSQCERIALVLHYTHICCAMWIVALAAAVAEYCACDTFLPLKYNYLLAYGVPAVIVMRVSSPSQCERIALVLHYTHICCAMWIVALAAAVAEYCACDTFLPLKYNYLLAYGVPAVIVMRVSSPSQCERTALVLHYTHICCAMWIVALAAAVAEYCTCDTFLPLKYNYLLAYGVPAVIVMRVSSPSQCERIALVLHYTHICCAMWIVALAAAVAEYCACDTFLPLKYNYLLAYGVPAVIVMGMVMGFMIPAMILILINTAIVILGLQSVNKKQAEVLATKIQELVDHHIANWPTNEIENMGDKNASLETLDNIYTPGSSRKNTDSSETLDKDNYLSEDECSHYPNNLVQVENGTELTWNTEGNELKTYLNLCLVLEPFFAVNWVMGVVAIENAQHWIRLPGSYNLHHSPHSSRQELALLRECRHRARSHTN
ncbi:Uncharacterized protein OBRU01_22761, partial [Operophtera brumata]